ncbi:hypothetical protein QWZ08_02685 [Ferruginibacter paludis]|uniref:hypothetical protein n=1 Tax=Ferruginibacter paludis TaxID=1310417 RepID=UPI0025B363F2|nr:hypothetical protein [Ferruginibacter paludis]MDN3654514.1 hypothetical protein [Ferruginibacter paludis]
MKRARLILATVLLQIGFSHAVSAHPGSGIVVDKYGNVYFIHSKTGVVKISTDGEITYIHKATDGHWMCLDEQGLFSKTKPTYFERITPDGIKPAILYAGGGSPIAMGSDGNFYYCGGQKGDKQPGAKTLIRETPSKQQTVVSAALEKILNELNDGITGLAAAPDSSLYVACWNSLLKVTMDGRVTTIAHPVDVRDCDEDPADHNRANRGMPLLRGIAVGSDGLVYIAATSCHCVLKIAAGRTVQTILKADRPWSPTGVAIHNGDIYVLEYTNANGPATEGWFPRVRKISKDGKVTTIADLSVKK